MANRRFNYAEKHHLWDDSNYYSVRDYRDYFNDNGGLKETHESETVSKLENIKPISHTTDNLSKEEMDKIEKRIYHPDNYKSDK